MADAAAQRALVLLGRQKIAESTVSAQVRHTLCSLCESCIGACPYGARYLDEEEEKVVVIPGNAFGEQGEGHVRCCYATSVHEIEEALNRIKRFVDRHRA